MPSGFAKFAPLPERNRQLTCNCLLPLLSTEFFAASQSGVFGVLIAREWFKAILDGMQLRGSPLLCAQLIEATHFHFPVSSS